MMVALGSGIEIFLHPGEWYFGDEDTRIRTTLGSCVAITLWHRRLRIGGMCHFMLPGTDEPKTTLNARYGNDALQLLLAEIHRHGTQPSEYEAKLFGGGNMFGTRQGGNSVADRNVVAAEALVRRYQLNVVARSLGGQGHRQLVFNLADGDVWLRHHPAHESRSNAGGAA